MRRLAGVTLWLLIGLSAAAGVYWGFLNTPESSVTALLLSATLSIVTLVVVAITVNGASLAWSRGWSSATIRRSMAGVLAFIPAALLAGVIWWITDKALGWVSAYSGQISAWFIARFGWADASSFFNLVNWTGRWLQWVLGPMLALSLLGSVLVGEWATARWRWLARAVSPFRLTFATLWVAIFVTLPWIYVLPWRPRALPPSVFELSFVGIKLLAIAIIATVGLALVIRESSAPISEN